MRPSLAAVIAAELVTLASLAWGAALVGAAHSRTLALLLAGTVFATWLVAQLRRRGVRALPFVPGPAGALSRTGRTR